MKSLLLIFACLCLGVFWLNGRIETQNRKIARLQNSVDSLQEIVRVRKWIDRRNFSKLISNVQYINANMVIKRPQIKWRIDQFEEHWALWQELGEE